MAEHIALTGNPLFDDFFERALEDYLAAVRAAARRTYQRLSESGEGDLWDWWPIEWAEDVARMIEAYPGDSPSAGARGVAHPGLASPVTGPPSG